MFVLHNPHSFDMLFRPLSYFFIKKRPHLKYQHLIELMFDSGLIYIALDYSESSLLPSRKFINFPFFLRYLIVNTEVTLWRIINRKYRFSVVRKKNILKDKVLFSFSYKGATYPTKEKYTLCNTVKGICFHLSHYMIQTKSKSDFIKKYAEKSVVMADVDLTSNSFYQNFFPGNMNFFVVPFQVSSRFISKTPFSERKNKILISGTVHDLSQEEPREYYSDFVNFFKSNAYHEIRNKYFGITHHKDIDVHVSAFRQEGNALQAEYFKINLVEMLNDYKFVCYDKELSGAPAITTFEAIACGCIPIVHQNSFSGLDLGEKVNFIEFGDDIDDFDLFLKESFSQYQCDFNIANDFNIRSHLIQISRSNLNKIKQHFSSI